MDGKIKIDIRTFLRATTGDLYKFFTELNDKYGDIFTLKVSRYTIHVFLSPIHVQHVLTGNAENYIKDASPLGIVEDLVGKYGLLTTNNQVTWKKDRETLNSFFTEDNVQDLVSLIANETENSLDALEDAVTHELPININHTTTSLTLKILIKSFYSDIDINLDYIVSVLNAATYHSNKYSIGRGKLLGVLPAPAYFKGLEVKREIIALGNQIVDRCLKAENNNLIKSLLNVYKTKTGKSDVPKEHLIEEALTFLIAGHDSTAVALTWTFIYLSLNPSVQKKMYEEVAMVIGNRKPTMADIPSLLYTRAVFSEAIRLQPVIPILVRKAVQDDMIGSLKISKDDRVIIPIYHIHRLAHYWPNPEGFDPERFLKPLSNEYKYLYLPFSVGQRSCIGRHFSIMEATIILAMMAQRYKLHLKSGSVIRREAAIFNKPKLDTSMTIHFNN